MGYLEKIGVGSLNNELDQVELKFVNFTREQTDMIDFVFPDLHRANTSSVILATLNSSVDEINNLIISRAPGFPTTYR